MRTAVLVGWLGGWVGRRWGVTCCASMKFSSSVSEMVVVYVCISPTRSVSLCTTTSPLPLSLPPANHDSKVFEAPHVK